MERNKVIVAIQPSGSGYASAVANLFSRCPSFDVLYTNKKIIKLVGDRVTVKPFRRTGTLENADDVTE